jgi:DNA ligase-1
MDRMSIPSGYKPNLAATLTKPELIKFPVYCSPKIDGIRCVVFDGVAYSRSLKPIPHSRVQEFARTFAHYLEGMDGELTVGSDTDANCMQNSMAVMSKKGNLVFAFHVFDVYDPSAPFDLRYGEAFDRVEGMHFNHPGVDIRKVPQHRCYSLVELEGWELKYLGDGYEGLMVRAERGAYKCGRSTEREGGLVKVKRFTDAEAEVIGFVEEMHNGNTATLDALGRTERSSVSAGLVGKQTLGALRCRTTEGIEFNIGTGFTADDRAYIWRKQSEHLGLVAKYKHFEHGVKDAPRHPVFLGFRHKDDMS